MELVTLHQVVWILVAVVLLLLALRLLAGLLR